MSTSAKGVLQWLLESVLIGATAGMAGVVVQTLALVAGNLSVAVSARSVTALFWLIVVLSWSVRAWHPTSFGFHLTAAAFGYAMMPLSWSGQALAGRFLTGDARLSLVLDLLLWLAMAGGVVELRRHRLMRAVDPAVAVRWAR